MINLYNKFQKKSFKNKFKNKKINYKVLESYECNENEIVPGYTIEGISEIVKNTKLKKEKLL